MKDKKIIAEKYIVEGRLGSGGEGVAFLVKLVKDKDKKDTDTEPKYLVAKVIEYDEAHLESKDYPKDEEFEKKLKRKIDLFEKIQLIKHPYILECITSGKGSIEKNNIIKKIRNYFIFEYAQRGDLWKIIAITGGFGERCGKFIFKKILLGVQKLHSSGIYHRDLKVDNIFLDNDYNPKISDFGLCTDLKGKLKKGVGTKNHKPPQMFLVGGEYTGEKADIFSLGCVLFSIVVGGNWFSRAHKKDDLYYYIINKESDKYFEKLSSNNIQVESLTKDFKDLYISMIAYEEEERPQSIDQILEDKWFKEIDGLNDEKQKELEDEVKKKFIEKEEKVKEFLKPDPNKLKFLETFLSKSENKGNSNDEIEYYYFSKNSTPKEKKIQYEIKNYIKIKGNFNYYYFMNLFVNKIKEKCKEKNEECTISNITENYKCDIIFKVENENEENKDVDEDENEDENENEIDEEKKENKCVIQLKLYQTGCEEYLIRFLKEYGELSMYYNKVIQIISLGKQLIAKLNNN